MLFKHISTVDYHKSVGIASVDLLFMLRTNSNSITLWLSNQNCYIVTANNLSIMGIHPARILRQRSIPPPSLLVRRKAVQEIVEEETSCGWKVGPWYEDKGIFWWREWKGGGWWDLNATSGEDVPHTYDMVTVMAYVVMSLLLVVLGLFLCYFTLVSGTTSPFRFLCSGVN